MPKQITNKKYSFGAKFPKLLNDWDYSKNLNIDPYKLAPGANIKIWWICKNNHSWLTSLSHRAIGGTGCAQCNGKKASKENNFAIKYPDKIKFFDKAKNNFNPEDILAHSGIKIYWKCEYGHEWHETPYSCMRRPTACKKCVSFGFKYPQIAKEWDYDKNNKSPFELLPYSKKIVAWKCLNGHSYNVSIAGRIVHLNKGKKYVCPKCNSFGYKFPDLLYKWDYSKNTKSPLEYSWGSEKKVWWKCNDCNNSWKSTVASGIKNNCQKCNLFHNEQIMIKIMEEIYGIPYNKETIDITYNNKNIKQKTLIVDFCFMLNSKKYYIEYNGDQHYRPVSFGSKNEKLTQFRFEQQKLRDKWLRKYCKTNNIILIEIDGRKYKYDKIKKYLAKQLLKYKIYPLKDSSD